MPKAQTAHVPVFLRGNARTRVAEAIRAVLINRGYSKKDEKYQLCIQDMHYPLLDLIDPDADIELDQAKAFAYVYAQRFEENDGIAFPDYILFATYINTCKKK